MSAPISLDEQFRRLVVEHDLTYLQIGFHRCAEGRSWFDAVAQADPSLCAFATGDADERTPASAVASAIEALNAKRVRPVVVQELAA